MQERRFQTSDRTDDDLDHVDHIGHLQDILYLLLCLLCAGSVNRGYRSNPRSTFQIMQVLRIPPSRRR